MTRSSILSLFYLCSIAALAVEGFQVGKMGSTVRLPRGVSLRAETTGDLRSVDPPFFVKVPVASAVATKPVAVAEAPLGTIDEGIYQFNKWLIDTVYAMICFLYPVKGNERDFARFFVLETVARVPYFAYLTCLHFKETFGVRYDNMCDRMRAHYAEVDNETHHLLITESLGGNSSPVDQAFAHAMAFFYFWYVLAIYFWNDSAAYHLSELIEDHAYNTYDKFLTDHEDYLKSQPVPDVARQYYEKDNPFMFDLFCTVKMQKDRPNIPYSQRRPKLETLYDVFVCIRNDEKEHWKTLCNLVQYDDMNAVCTTDVKSTVPFHAPTN